MSRTKGQETEEICSRRVKWGGSSEARSVEKPVGSEWAGYFCGRALHLPLALC